MNDEPWRDLLGARGSASFMKRRLSARRRDNAYHSRADAHDLLPAARELLKASAAAPLLYFVRRVGVRARAFGNELPLVHFGFRFADVARERGQRERKRDRRDRDVPFGGPRAGRKSPTEPARANGKRWQDAAPSRSGVVNLDDGGRDRRGGIASANSYRGRGAQSSSCSASMSLS